MEAEPVKAEPLRTEPVTGAGFDPAFIPGITGPTPTGAVAKDPVDKAPKPTADKPTAEESTVEGPTVEGPTVEEPADAEAEEPPADGPVFEASDRRAKIVADHKGVRLSLDEESCEFRWDEIAAVETESPRFGKRYTVTVHTPDRRWYPIEIEAAARARFKEWDEQLDAVLDAYFEEA
ncbi:hypothetical protein GCM10018980_07150 [Streptomyces capoamus]|uniref:Uncharacterized protein n=1 Tax=Streptomyces capoamus TaxID=68183 RepID=A0A919BZM8_9ACTN|nr:hypothetical protein GCM10010501_38670 [Streptomyces libani subsp. rufus]GHG36419.1 hypothetical protein GCM10018980_07150 [Streptomyces capoamus]